MEKMMTSLSETSSMDNPSSTNKSRLNDFSFIKISGSEASKFLQGQLTINVETLNDHAKLAAHCNSQGRIISLFYILKWAESFLICLPPDNLDIAISALKKYAVFFKVQIEDISAQLKCIGSEDCLGLEEPHYVGTIHYADYHPSLTQSVYIYEQSDFIIENDKLSKQWKLKRLLAKIPMIYAATSAKFLPHDLELPSFGAIDFHKGCYTGQEIIARMQYRGKLKTHLYCAEINTSSVPALASDIISKSSVVGSLVDYCAIDGGYRILISADENKLEQLYISTPTPAFLKLLT